MNYYITKEKIANKNKFTVAKFPPPYYNGSGILF